jgi:hypothetical protein
VKHPRALLLAGLLLTGLLPLLAACSNRAVGSVVMMPEEAPVMSRADSLALRSRATATAEADSAHPLAQRILMLPFEDVSDYEGPWPVHSGMAAILADSLRSNRFLRIIPADSVMAFLAADERLGDIDPRRAADLARFLDADWAALGRIEDLTMKRFQATVPLGGYRSYQGIVSASLVLVNALDGRPLHEVSAEGVIDSKQTGITNPAAYVPLEIQYRLLGEIEWGSEQFRESLVGKAMALWAAKAALGVGEDIRPPAELKVLEPKVIDVDGPTAYINVGLADGIRSGDKYGVWDHGRPLRDPDTGAVLGNAPPRRVGVVQVEQILNDHLTQVRILDGGEQIAVGYRLRAE